MVDNTGKIETGGDGPDNLEGTAHLDVDNEKRINESLRRLRMTRISVAHRPEIMSGADKILRIGSGQR